MANWGEDSTEPGLERLEASIKGFELRAADKRAYLEFLKANPLFQEFLRLKAAAG